MIFWRISRHVELTGTGGLKASARWHHAGHPIVYLAENPASALLEVCVHTAASDVPPQFTLLQIEGPDLAVPAIDLGSLSQNWRAELQLTRQIGTDWLHSGQSVLLRVPSAIVPHTVNFLFNPLHPDAPKFRVVSVATYPFDLRIKHGHRA